MKAFAKSSVIAAAVVMLSAMSGCHADPAAKIEGDYTLEAQSVQINGTIINLGDWPGAAVHISGASDGCAKVTVDSLLPGYASFTAMCGVTENGRDKYSFEGEFPGTGRKIGINGNVNKGRLTLSIADTVTSPVAGRWTIAYTDGSKADIKISFSNSRITEIPIGNGSISIDSAVSMVNSVIGTLASSKLIGLRYLELDRTGYVNIAWNGYVDERIKPLLSGVIQYYPGEDSGLHIYLRRTIADGIGLPVSPLDFPVSCSISGDSMTLASDQDDFGPWLDIISSAVAGYSYSDYLDDGSPLGALTEDKFQEYKSILVVFNGILSMPSTEYGISITFDRIK